MGLGQAYSGQRKKGYFFFLLNFFCVFSYFIFLRLFNEPFPKADEEITFASPSYRLTVILGLVFWIVNIYNAYVSAKKANDGSMNIKEAAGRSVFIFLRNIILGVIIVVALIIFLAMLIAAFTRVAKSP
jgi:hypothetical protein